MKNQVKINGDRLMRSIFELGRFGGLEGGGVSRLALTEADRQARDYVANRMREMDMSVWVDGIGNIIGTYAGNEDLPPVMMGSHIDTVAAGGLYDGNYGVLSGLEVVAALKDQDCRLRRPVAVGVFTNEEGVRFQPDMLGSLVFAGGCSLEEALATTDQEGLSVAEALRGIGYHGPEPVTGFPVDRYIELHIEQGPILDLEKCPIGVVEGVQGISWTEFTLTGQANHAGTTPMNMRHDAGYVAAKIMARAYELALGLGSGQHATVGRISEFGPGMVNVIPDKVVFTVDLRNYREEVLQEAEKELFSFAEALAAEHGVGCERKSLARFQPVVFAEEITGLIRAEAEAMGLGYRVLPSGAGHDAQMLARVCPSGMIFVPNKDGISHNIKEHAEPEDLITGAELLRRVVMSLADRP
ncbi:Zn-dependent hydrolase [Deltaproteobacteria bacterium Smac51]|nr:Zn-dependent hydrolase [Deltaproteobacteria bacterium Smac51]